MVLETVATPRSIVSPCGSYVSSRLFNAPWGSSLPAGLRAPVSDIQFPHGIPHGLAWAWIAHTRCYMVDQTAAIAGGSCANSRLTEVEPAAEDPHGSQVAAQTDKTAVKADRYVSHSHLTARVGPAADSARGLLASHLAPSVY
ncbi:hypothetical protein NDU88_004936 [Pleurodeles waltl]|uniref:Uncharacterized protein n=1 Tax=Pleurodeles waltl TaxID=8319 RepID=A0AAV7NKZ8_PLEWA|nr:hypothetical protein NDU88_004936 [Pleurodeles waltl]